MEDSYNNDWRKLTMVIYQKPRDSKMLGTIELDVTEIEQFIQKKRQQKQKITLTQVMLLLFARGIHQDVPELNCYVRRGHLVHRSSVDVSISVLEPNGQLSSVKVNGAETLSLSELSEIMHQKVDKARKGKSEHIKEARNMVVRIPWPFRQWLVNFVRWATVDLGLSLPFLGVNPDSFGTFVLSNLGTIGLDIGYPALAPFSNVAMVVTQGSVNSKPVVYQGEIAIRRMLTVSAAVDHRVVDAAHLGKLFQSLRRQIKKPELLETSLPNPK